MSEAGAGSDVVSMKLRPTQAGGYRPQRHQVLDHQRPYADTLVVYAKTGPAKAGAGITAFLIEKGMPGFPSARRSTRWACAARPPPNWCSTIAKCRKRTSWARSTAASAC
jgi:isovaleryl-CoA dehydrogenase